MKRGKRLLALLLTILLVLSALSVSALAETTGLDPEENEIPEETVQISEEQSNPENGEDESVPTQDDTVPENSEDEPAQPDNSVPEDQTESAEQEDPTDTPESEEQPEEALEEELPEEEEKTEEAEPVKVTFTCSCEDVMLDVFSDTDWYAPEEEEPFTYLLMPGNYYYAANCEGYVKIKSFFFTVAEGEPEQSVDIKLTELGDAFTVLYCDPSLEGYDFRSDYLNSKKTGGHGMLLMASFNRVYDTSESAGEYVRNTLTNSNKGFLIKTISSGAIKDYVNNGQVKLSFRTKKDQTKWNSDYAAIYNSAFAHSISNPVGGDYFTRGRTVGMMGGYDSVTWDGTDYTYDFVYIPYMTDTVEQETEASAVEAELVTVLGLKDEDKSEYEKLKAIYTYITANVSYDGTPYSQSEYQADVHSAYAGFVKKCCVCQGYATMVYRLCLEAGIDCRSVGISSGHEWNIVKLDGKWYFLDSTWDAGNSQSQWRYFIKGLNTWKSIHSGYCPGKLPTPVSGIISGDNGDNIRFSYGDCSGTYSLSASSGHGIIYVLNGGTNSPDNPSTYSEGTTLVFKNPSKEGASFIGWFTDEACTRRIASTSGRTSELTIYAAWGYPVNVTFDPCEGSLVNPETAERVVVYGTNLGELPAVQRLGYKLIGWYTAPVGGSMVQSNTPVVSDDDVTYYAHWSIENYTITYKMDGGSMPPGMPNPSVYNIEMQGLILNSPVKNGYIFRGWFRDSSFRNRVESLDGMTGNLVLYAEFTGEEYYISADYSGGTVVKGSPVPESYFNRQKTNVILPTLAKDGYTFKGWYNLETGSKITRILRTANKDYNIQARFTPKTYKIVYNLGGGKLPSGSYNPKSYNIESSSIEFCAPFKKGYTFIGWFDAAGNPVTGVQSGSTGNVKVYARYSENSYTLEYSANGGSGSMVAPLTTLYSKYIWLLKSSLTRTGYKFAGWNTSQYGTGKNYARGARVRMLSAEDGATVTLYANWKPVKYHITYKYYGGTMPSGRNPSYYSVESSFVLKEPVRRGYTFLGWYTEYGTRVESIEPGRTGPITLYARWEKN